jgi:DNA polymerase
MPLAPLAMPDDWDGFQAWLAADPAVPGTGWHRQRILPVGRQNAPLMLLSLCPEMADHDAGALHSGSAGTLLDAMLRAIGLERGQCYCASLALTRPPGGRLDTGQSAALMPLLWHHVRLARPERLLVFGGDLARMITGEDIAALRGCLRLVNHDGVKVELIAVQHPMLLLDRPARKAAAWDSLKRLARG